MGARVLGLVPARGGSKGIPGKNLRELAGKPLLAYAADCALSSGVLDRVILSTDSEEIADAGRSYGLEVPFMRPSELATDSAAMLPVVQHAVSSLEADGWKPDAIMLIQPTAPLRRPEHLISAVRLFLENECDSVVSVTAVPGHLHPYWTMVIEDGELREFHRGGLMVTRRQELPPVYARNGALYLFRRDLVMIHNTIYGARCLPLVMLEEESVNLDSMDDWELAQIRIEARMRGDGRARI